MCPADGDARLAFLLGHELAHLAKDDFSIGPRSWRSKNIQDGGPPPAAGGNAEANRRRDGRVRQAIRDIVRIKELQADSYGLIYMTVAGYDPAVIVRAASFFEQWVRQLPHAVAESRGASTPRPTGPSS